MGKKQKIHSPRPQAYLRVRVCVCPVSPPYIHVCVPVCRVCQSKPDKLLLDKPRCSPNSLSFSINVYNTLALNLVLPQKIEKLKLTILRQNTRNMVTQSPITVSQSD